MTETLSFSVRLGGVRLAKLAVSLSLVGILLLVSRTSNMIQGPLVGNLIDRAKLNPDLDVLPMFQLILFAASVGTLLAMFFYPTFTKLSMVIIRRLEIDGSFLNVMRVSNVQKLRFTKHYVTVPRFAMLHRLRIGGIPKRIMLINTVVTGIYTVGVLSSLYATFLAPSFTSTASQLTGLINGVATILLTLFLDPHIAMLTERSLQQKAGADQMGKLFGWLMISRFFGTLLAQLFLVPASHLIIWTSAILSKILS